MSEMNQINETEMNAAFPKARQDEMTAHARSFDRRNWQAARNDASWDWTMHVDDGAEAIYLAQQLAFIRQGAYEIRDAALKAMSLIPHDFNQPDGMGSMTVLSEDFTGDVAIGKDAPDEIPSIGVKNGSGTMQFFNGYSSYSYSFQEAADAMFAGRPLQARKAAGARKIMAINLEKIAWLGNATAGIKGLLNQSGTTTYTMPADGAGGSTLLSDKDSFKVLRDLNGTCDAVTTATDDIEVVDTLLMPVSVHAAVSTRIVGDGTSVMIMDAFQKGRSTPVRVDRLNQLESNSDWTGKRIAAYVNNPMNVQHVVPVQFRQYAPQTDGLRVKTICMFRSGGVALWLPKSLCYADNA